jgi:hypothetical protein
LGDMKTPLDARKCELGRRKDGRRVSDDLTVGMEMGGQMKRLTYIVDQLLDLRNIRGTVCKSGYGCRIAVVAITAALFALERLAHPDCAGSRSERHSWSIPFRSIHLQ